MLNLTPIARLILGRHVKAARSWRGDNIRRVQLRQLDYLTRKGERTEYGRAHGLKRTTDYAAFAAALPVTGYPEIRNLVMTMADGATDGLVRPDSARWTNYRGDVTGVSHQDMTDTRQAQLSGFDPVEFCLRMAEQLQELGF